MPGMTSHRNTERRTGQARRDHLWVLFVIAAACLAEVFPSWVGIGNISGFPKIGHIPTDWVLAVAMEAYWGYALYAWLVASPGPRSRAMAMWSCAVVFAFSLAGQVLYHEITAPAGATPGKRVVIGFVTSLPVIVLALIAVLIHLRHSDRAEAAEVEREAAEQTELAKVRAELGETRKARQQAEADRDTARAETAAADSRAETLTRKLTAAESKQAGNGSGNGGGDRRRKSRQPKAATGSGGGAPTADIDIYAAALEILASDPDISASELGRRLDRSEGRGRQIKRELTQAAPQGPDGGA